MKPVYLHMLGDHTSNIHMQCYRTKGLFRWNQLHVHYKVKRKFWGSALLKHNDLWLNGGL